MQALYKDWFVNFEPFGGVRPSGWNNTNIYAIANIIYGAPFASKLFNTDGLGKPIIRIRDLKEQAFVTFTTEEHNIKEFRGRKGKLVICNYPNPVHGMLKPYEARVYEYKE